MRRDAPAAQSHSRVSTSKAGRCPLKKAVRVFAAVLLMSAAHVCHGNDHRWQPLERPAVALLTLVHGPPGNTYHRDRDGHAVLSAGPAAGVRPAAQPLPGIVLVHRRPGLHGSWRDRMRRCLVRLPAT